MTGVQTCALPIFNIKRSVGCLYTKNKLSERKIKKTIPSAIATKRIKYLEINLTKEVKGLSSENYKTLMKETEDDTKILMTQRW